MLLGMATSSWASEIVESVEDESRMDENTRDSQWIKPIQKHTIEDDINKLFEAIDIRNSHRGSGQLERGAREAVLKRAMKRPMRIGYSQPSAIGISESVSLKQALRGLCISQASEMAAIKKRMPKPSGLSDAGAVKRLYQAVVVETNESGQPINSGRGNLMEISLVAESGTLNLPDKVPKSNRVPQVDQSTYNSESSFHSSDEFTHKLEMSTASEMNEIVPSSACLGCEHQKAVVSTSTTKKLDVLDEIVPALDNGPITQIGLEKKEESKLYTSSFSSPYNAGNNLHKPVTSTPHLTRSVFRSKNFNKKKALLNSTSPSCGAREQRSGEENHVGCSSSDAVCQTPNPAMVKWCRDDGEVSPISGSASTSSEVSSKFLGSAIRASENSFCYNKTRRLGTKVDERSSSREKGDISQSSKSSIGNYSSTTSFSEESQTSGASRSGYRPHMSKDVRWEAINSVRKQYGDLGFRHFKLLRKLGGGDIGTVYLSELVGTNCLFAVKVMDNEFLASRRKIARALMEKEILEILDHPFLPTLYTHFTSDKFSCLVMEFCPGGDLHVLRQKQPNRSFTEQAARFYVAEVLLALEYLHMLGVVYRDLKPENILVREDGHIMLTDFDLSLRCAANPTLVKSSSLTFNPPKKMSSACSESSCIDPFCLNPSWQVSCFTPRFLSTAAKTRKLKSDIASQVSPLPQLVVEPTTARSNSFVGTHEYLAPEIIKGEGHGSAVDWWTLGIFLYELLYGKTPFKGAANEDTLANVVSQCLKFPSSPMVSSYARDLIRRLLQKEPENRLGSERGAAEIKQHPFFEGLNFALIRCATPPELPKLSVLEHMLPETVSQKTETVANREETGVGIAFEVF